MTSTTEGLEQVAPGEQVNSESGFAAALAAKGVEPDATTATDTSIASGLETAEPGPARGPDGKFVPKAAPTPTPDTPPTGADTSTDGDAAFTSDDPAVAALLAKYNGNVEEAIKGAAHMQSLIGRRDEEREQLSRELAELRGLVQGLQQGAQRPAAPVLSDEQVEEQSANLIGTLGHAPAATRAANESLETGDDRIYDAVLEQWALESPIQAQRFDLDFQIWKRERDKPAPVAATANEDPYVASLKAKDEMTQTFAALQSRIGAEQYTALTTIGQDGESPLTRALATLPPAVVEMTVSDDADVRLAALELARDRAVAGGLLTAAAPSQQDDIPASVQRKLLGAGVATAGLRPAAAAPEGVSDQQSKEDAIAAFKSAIVGAETTSVASGLTYGPQQK